MEGGSVPRLKCLREREYYTTKSTLLGSRPHTNDLKLCDEAVRGASKVGTKDSVWAFLSK